MASYQTRTSNMFHSARHASWKARNASGKAPSERALGTCQSHPPPMQAHEPSGQKGGTTCTSPKPVEPIIMLPALARRSSTSAGKPRPTQKYHLCRQASPDAEVIALPASLARRRSTTSAGKPRPTQKLLVLGSRGPSKRCRQSCPTQPGIDVVDARSRMRSITRMTQPLLSSRGAPSRRGSCHPRASSPPQ
jgi:hypothetical protein